ncbi:hypothetical protein STEG23_029157 [Scotinomys teguina]
MGLDAPTDGAYSFFNNLIGNPSCAIIHIKYKVENGSPTALDEPHDYQHKKNYALPNHDFYLIKATPKTTSPAVVRPMLDWALSHQTRNFPTNRLEKTDINSQSNDKMDLHITQEWIRKMWYIYTMEYYAAEKNNDIMKFADKWMELENIILSEVTQTQKDKHGSSITADINKMRSSWHLGAAAFISMVPPPLFVAHLDAASLQQAFWTGLKLGILLPLPPSVNPTSVLHQNWQLIVGV